MRRSLPDGQRRRVTSRGDRGRPDVATGEYTIDEFKKINGYSITFVHASQTQSAGGAIGVRRCAQATMARRTLRPRGESLFFLAHDAMVMIAHIVKKNNASS